MKRDLEPFTSELIRTKCGPVEEGNTEVGQDLLDSFDKVGYIGLAAPQIGLPYRVCVCYLDNELIVMNNPEYTPMNEEKKVFTEGCASLPGVECKVPRYTCIKVTYKDKDWKDASNIYFGLNACVVQHEIDHLDGVLMTKVAVSKTYKKRRR